MIKASPVPPFFSRRSLRWKLVGVMLAVAGASLFLAGAGMLWHARSNFQRDMAKNLQTLADVVGLNSTAALLFNDPKAATETLSALAVQRHVLAGGLYDAQGRLFVLYRREPGADKLPEQISVSSRHLEQGDRWVLTEPIRLRDRTVGAIRLVADTAEWRDTWLSYVGIVTALFAGVLAVGFGISLWLQRLFTEPVRNLALLMQRVATERNYTLRARKHADDEMGVLAEGFNSMLEQIERRRAEVEAAQTELKQRFSELAKEVAERQQAEEALRTSEERYRLLVAAGSAVVWTTDSAGAFAEPQPAWETHTGQPWEAYRGFGWIEAVHPDDRATLRAAWDRALASASAYEHEARVYHEASRRFRYALTRAVPLRGADGAVREWIGTITDIDDRKRGEEQFRLAVEAAPNGMILVDQDGRILLTNRRAEAMFGYERQELIGQRVEMLVPERSRTEHPNRRLGFFSEPAERPMGAGRDLYGRRKDGRHVPVEIGLNPITTHEGTFCLASVIDITERQRAEQETKRYMEELQRSNQELGQFAYVASHDLQEPLRAISGCVQLLAQRYEGKLDARAQELIDHAVSGAVRMQSLINDLLSYSRVGTRTRAFEPVELAQPLAQAIANLDLAIVESRAKITWDELPTATGDATQLTQLFQNLISNAIKFRGEVEPVIHVGAERKGDRCLFYVRDNGIGIESQYFERIFGVFQRLHTRSHYPGTGIGLAICRKIVERHGGRIWVESVPGSGATFYFTLSPAKAQNEQTSERVRQLS